MATMSYGWEGNPITLAMCHRLTWFIHLWAQSLLSKGHEHPTNTPYGVQYNTIQYNIRLLRVNKMQLNKSMHVKIKEHKK